MDLIAYLFRQSWKLLLLATVASTGAGLAGAGVVSVIGEGLDASSRAALLAPAFFGLCLLYLVAKSCSEISLLNLTQTLVLRLRINISRKLLETSFKRLQELGKHRLLVIITRDVDTFVMAATLVPQVFGNGILVMVCLAYMAWLSWKMFMMFTVAMIVCMFLYHMAERGPIRQLRKIREGIDVLYGNFRSLIEGSKELQLNAHRGSLFVDKVIAPSAQILKRDYVRCMTRYSWIVNVGAMLFYLVIGLLLFVAPTWVPLNGQVMTKIILLLLFLVRPISELMMALPSLHQAAIAIKRIQQLDATLTGAGESAPPSVDPFGQAGPLILELRGVSHHYPSASDDSQFMLGPMDFKAEQGEIVFIVGGNGSGKTTLAMLLLGFYAPESGDVYLNGVRVTDENRARYRERFSAVFADFHLFEQLLGENQEELGERAAHYLKSLGLSHKVRVADGKFSTLALSTGQRKRLALVSSYLEDRPVYLFDEWASDQDPTFKRVFYTELLPELKARGKTVIVISHDDSYFGCADRIVKLKDGHMHDAEHKAGSATASPIPA